MSVRYFVSGLTTDGPHTVRTTYAIPNNRHATQSHPDTDGRRTILHSEGINRRSTFYVSRTTGDAKRDHKRTWSGVG